MKDVGDRFGRGELILPFVLQSAEVMKKAVAHLEQFLEKKEGTAKGTVVLATVFGDVHDIGKNLVNTILTNNGYAVHDLGKQVPMNAILEKAVEVEADAIGLSALLVSTSKQMPICVQEQDARGMQFPVIVGGAAINREFGRRIALLDDGTRFFDPGLFYAKDAFEGLALMDELTGSDARRNALVERTRDEAFAQRDRASAPRPAPPSVPSAVKRELADDPAAAVLGRAHARGRRSARSLAVLRSAQSLPAVVGRSQHQGRRLRPAAARRLRAAVEALPRGGAARRFLAAASRVRILSGGGRERRRRAVRSFRSIARSRALHLSAASRRRTLEPRRLSPRTGRRRNRRRCAAGRDGRRARGAAHRRALRRTANTANRTSCTASPCNRPKRLRSTCTGASVANSESPRIAASGTRGGTAPAPTSPSTRSLSVCSDATRRIGVTLTQAHQLVPEQSTAAIVIHHPRATYFNAAAVRELVSPMSS